jgi:hypothetical protein
LRKIFDTPPKTKKEVLQGRLRDKESQTFVCLRIVTKSVTKNEPLFSDILVNSKIGFKMPKIISYYYIYMLENEGKAMLANKNNTLYIIAASINNNIE